MTTMNKLSSKEKELLEELKTVWKERNGFQVTNKLYEAMDEAWAQLPDNYQWLKEWDYV